MLAPQTSGFNPPSRMPLGMGREIVTQGINEPAHHLGQIFKT
jgi:hypothetical protein